MARADDLHLLRRDEIGDDPSRAYERLEEIDDRPPTPEERSQLRRLADDLVEASPGLDRHEVESPFMVQLGYEAERPVVIDMMRGSITMSWSYGADEARARAALDEVRLYLPVFERHGYVAFDPQLDRLFDGDRDAGDAIDVHRSVRSQMPPDRRPWWTRWFG